MVELEARVDGTFNAFRGQDRRPAGRRQHDRADPAHERRQRRAPGRVGGLEAGRRRGRRPRRRARPAPQPRRASTSARATTSPSPSRPSELDEDRLFATLDEVDRVDGRAVRGVEGRASTRRSPPGSAAPVGELGRGTTTTPSSRNRRPTARSTSIRWLDADGPRSSSPPALRRASGSTSRGVIERSDLLPRAGKSQHAFCIDVDREGDVRVLSNNSPSEYWTETMLHEFGHALYDLARRPRPPVAAAHDAPAHDRGHRDALRPAGAATRSGSAPSPASSDADLDRAAAAPRARPPRRRS